MLLKPIVVILSVVTIHLFGSSISGQSTLVSDDNNVISEARSRYYSLPRLGFNGFQAELEPNWKVILGNTATRDNLRIFRRLHFSLTVDAKGTVNLTREFDEMPIAKLAPAMKQIHNNVQRLLGGFFGTWAFFTISSPFPELEISVENLRTKYRLSYAVQSTSVMLTMTPDYLITEGHFIDATTRRTIQPIFQKLSDGFLISGYHTIFESLGQKNRTTMDTVIEYRDVEGMRLPSRIQIKGTYGSEPVEADLKFNHHVLTSLPHE